MTMDCRGFERQLDASLAGDAPESLRREARAHMETCAPCRRLAALARASLRPSAAAEGLVEAVMRRTTGSPCDAAAEILAAAGGDVDETDRRLLDLHLGRCSPCRDLRETLTWLDGVLPEMAEVAPDPAFLGDVMRATVGRRRRRFAPVGAWPGRWLGVLVYRPRFAMEAAYVGAAILWLVFGTPLSPLRGVPGRALEIVQSGSAQFASIGPVSEALAMPASISRHAWDATAGRLLGRRSEGDQSRWRRVGDHVRSLSMHGLMALRQAASGDAAESLEQLRLMAIDCESIWKQLTRGTKDPRQTRIDSQSQEA